MKIRRRTLLKGSLAAAVVYLSGCAAPAKIARSGSLVGFTPVPRKASDGKTLLVADEYEVQAFIPWGEPLASDGPAWSWPATADAQAQQIGIGHDGMTYFPLSSDGRHGLLAINHEFGSNPHVIGKKRPSTADEVLASQHAHGVSVLEIRETNGAWELIQDSAYARRIHLNTEMDVAGPAAGHALLANRAGNPVMGTVNNCSNGQTPWGTYLTCEENFNLYFGSDGEFEPTEAQRRYSLAARGSYYGWHAFDPRFDLGHPDYANESNRFGWVVEVDPKAPTAKPIKRTALGRFKHEGATVVEGRDGRAVVYLGDDQVFEFIYKFVSRAGWREMIAEGVSPLDEGTLYVARFDEDGTGAWLPLTTDNPALSGRFRDQAEIVVHARLAATLVGATPMDRPEWVAVGPNGDAYCTLTKNKERKQADAANPKAPNPYGSIIRWHDEDDHVGLRFAWDHFLIADDVYDTEDSLSCPDGLLADPDGRLFICTDGKQRDRQPNQLLVADTTTGELSRLLVGVTDCEITGLTMTPDRRTLFVNVQHPGDGDPKVTSFPAADDGKTVPRDCTLAIRRKDGGIVGS